MKKEELKQLTSQQKMIWYMEQISPNTSMNNIGGYVLIHGSLDLKILEKSIIHFLNKTCNVFIRIATKDNVPYQYKCQDNEITSIDFHDFSKLNDPDNSFQEWITKKSQTPFSILNNQLFYVSIFKIDDSKIGYYLKFHHIICDGFSTFLMTSAIRKNYNGLLNNKIIDYHGFKYDYFDYIESEKKYYKTKRFEKNKKYWLEKFNSLDRLPKRKNTTNNTKGNRSSYIVNSELVKNIKLFCNTNKISLNTFYTGLMFLYLYKSNEYDAQVLGIPVLNRSGTSEKNTFGMFSVTMPFKYCINDNFDIIRYFNELKSELGLYYLNHKYPYDLLVKDLDINKYGFRSLYDICINYYNKAHENKYGDYVVENINFYSGHQYYSLQLIIKEWTDSDELELSYDYKECYSALDINILNNQLEVLTKQVLSNSNKKISDFSLISEESYNHIIKDFNNTFNQKSAMLSILESFDRCVLTNPHKIAISFNELNITYDELDKKSNMLAHKITDILKGQSNLIIPIIGRHSIELIVGIIGILKSGNAFLPLDIKINKDRMYHILNEVKTELILVNDFDLKLSEYNILDLKNNESYSQREEKLTKTFDYDNLAYVIYTSGSTGKPKGVMISQKSFYNYINWAINNYKLEEDEVFAFHSSISFDLTITSIFSPLLSGGQIQIYDPYEESKDFVLFRILNESKASIIKLTPSHLSLIKNKDLSESSINKIIVGGEELKSQLTNQVYEAFNGHVSIYNEYGPTEATVGCMIYKYNPNEEYQNSIPIGKPIDNTQIYILDKNFTPVPIGQTGEMYIAGDCLSLGYFRNNMLTDRHFIKNPFDSEKLMYRTGDIAKFINNKSIEFVGRNDNQIKLRGYRIELSEIDNQLLSHSDILEAVTLLKIKNENKVLCSYIITNESLKIDEVRFFLNKKLPEYMIPAIIIKVDFFPLTNNGKVDLKQLGLIEESFKDDEILDTEYNEIESVVVNSLRQLLNNENVNLDTNFFQLGGDSIIAIQLSTKLDQLGFDLAVNDILSNSSIRNMISDIDYKYYSNEEFTDVGKIEKTPIVRWFEEQSFKNPSYFNQSVMLKLSFDVDDDKLNKVFNYIVQQHSSLRINYKKNNLFYNDKHKNSQFNVKVVDIDDSIEYYATSIQKECLKIKSSFNLEDSLLFSACIFRLKSGVNYLFLTAHHIVIDGVSWTIILSDLKYCLNILNKTDNNLKILKKANYKEWADFQKNKNNELETINEINYWNSKFLGYENIIKLQSNNKVSLKKYKEIFSKDFTNNLIDAGSKYNLKLDEFLVISLAIMLFEVFNKSDLIIELEHNGRSNTKKNLSNIVGWFTSIYPTRLSSDCKDLDGVIKELKEQIRNIPNNGINYGLLKYSQNRIEHNEEKHIRFNYLGNFTNINNDLFTFSGLDHGLDIHRENSLSCIFEINTCIISSNFEISLLYNEYNFDIQYITSFVEKYKDKLGEMVSYCQDHTNIEVTPSDFDYSEISQNELDSIFI